MNRNILALFVSLATFSAAAKNMDRTDPVNWAKAGLYFKVEVPEALGWGLNVDAPLLEFLSVGGDFSFTWDLPRSGSNNESFILRTDVSVKPRIVFNDRFEAYSKVLIGPAFSFPMSNRCDANGCKDLSAVGVDFAVMPGFQFSLSREIGIFAEMGLGVSHFPRISETRVNGIFRIGSFFAF